MKEYLLLIRNEIDHQAAWPPERLREFLDRCRVYIERLTAEGRLKSAQPLVREGTMLSGREGAWREGPFADAKEVIVGYYHILANDLADAVAVAKGNPEFEFSTTARIEVRPVKTRETATGFAYPKHGD